MLGVVDCRSSSSSCISPTHMSYSNANDSETMNSILNMSPRLSSQLNPIVRLERGYWESEEMKKCNAIQCIPNSTPNHKSMELKQEIATLEVEIIRLERYLLSLYRTTFEDQMSNLSEPRPRIKLESPPRKLAIEPNSNSRAAPRVKRSLLRAYQSSPAHAWTGADTQSCDSSFKTSSKDRKNSISGHRSLADHLGASSLESSLTTPDRLSEDIVKCISSIYCKLANPNQTQQTGLSASPMSSLSSSSYFSSHNPRDSWSPCRNEDGPPHTQVQVLREDTKNSNGLHNDMVEVLKISLDDESFKFASAMLQKFRGLVRNLENVDPSKMKREEKLAFWINIHNALVMHAYLAYGMGSRVKNSTILKAAYSIGGQCINAYAIQTSILGIRPHHSSPWLQTLFSPGRKSKSGNSSHTYALEYPEPLVHFALCSGAYSDPPVRVYRAKNIFVDLKLSKSDFIQSNVYIHKETKIFLPKILYYFAKDTTLPMPGLLDTVNECLSDVQRKAIKTGIKRGKLEKYINWLPENSTFRYVFHGELSRGAVKSEVL